MYAGSAKVQTHKKQQQAVYRQERKHTWAKKIFRPSFSTRQYMLSRDFEIYYYNEPASEKVSIHSHDYYEF